MGNLVSSCGLEESSPSGPSNNSKNIKVNTKTNTTTNTIPAPANAKANTNVKANANLKANANTNKNTKTNTNTAPTPVKGVRFGNTNTRNIKNINIQMKKTPKPNLTKTAESSAIKSSEENPDIQTINPKANNVLEKSMKKALKTSRLAKPVAQGLTNPTTAQNKEAIFENDENTLLKMTNPPSKSGATAENIGEPTKGENMAGGRRRKTRKQRKHRKND